MTEGIVERIPPDSASCLACGYSLRGLSSRACPECGREFDPDSEWTMSVPRTPFAWEKRLLDPTAWPFDKIRRTLLLGLLVSAWFPPPNPLPILLLAAYWLRWAVPSLGRRIVRRRIVRRYYLPREMIRVDNAGIWRLRRMFGIALVLVGLHIPFFAGFAVSYPFLASSARYWLTQAPATLNPRPGPALYGTTLVLHRHATLQSIVYILPGGTLTFFLDPQDGRIRCSALSFWRDDRHGRC